MLYTAMRLEGIWQTCFVDSSGHPGWMRQHHVPPEVKKRFEQQRSRHWRLRDIAGYLTFATVLSLLYVLIGCSLDAELAATTSSHDSGCLQSRHVTTQHSTAHDAPTADAFHKLKLYPSYGPAVKHTLAPATGASQCSCSVVQTVSLLQVLCRHAAAAVATISRHNSSMGLGMLLQPRVLLRSAPLLYVWRLWCMADMLLLVKSVLCCAGLWLALFRPDLYCRPGVRTAIITAYILLPLVLLPLRLLTCNHAHILNAADSTATTTAAAAAAALPIPLHAAATSSIPPQQIAATALAAIRCVNPAQLPSWPAAYFTSCPVPATAEAYRALLPYASFVVIIDSLLHPLPLFWQALVNAASWLCLASCSVLAEACCAPVAMTVAPAPASVGVGSWAGSAHALGTTNCSSSSNGSTGMAVLLWEVLALSLDGLLLAVVLPVLLCAWFTHRSRQKFLQALGIAPDVIAESRNLPVKHMNAELDQLHKQQQPTQPNSSSSNAVEFAAPAAESSSTTATVLAPVTPASSDSLGVLGRELKNSNRRTTQAHMQQQASLSSNWPATYAAAEIAVVHTAGGQDKGLSLRHDKLAAAAPNNAGSNSGGLSSSAAAPDTPRSSFESTASSGGNNLAAAKGSKHGSGCGSSGCNNSQQRQAATSASTSPAGAAGANSTNHVRMPGTITAPQPLAAAAEGPVGVPPGIPSGALYSSPLETVVISFKLTASSSRGSSAATPTAPTTTVAAPATGHAQPLAAAAGDNAPAGDAGAAALVEYRPPALAGALAAEATGSGAGSGGTSPGLLQQQQQQQEFAASGALRQLQADIEAAVRTVVAQSQLHVLTTSVSSFPGCVHFVMSVSLIALQDVQCLAAAAAAAGAGAAAAGTRVDNAQVCFDGRQNSFGSSSSGSSNAAQRDIEAVAATAAGAGSDGPCPCAVPLARLVDWGQVVQQLQQQGLKTTAGEGGTADVAQAESPGDDSVCPLQLQYMLVQDGSGQETHWCWQRGTIAAAAAAPASAAPAGHTSEQGSAAASAFVSAVQRASFDLPNAAPGAATSGVGGGSGGANMETGSASQDPSTATSSNAHAQVNIGGSSAHDVCSTAYAGGVSSSSSSNRVPTGVACGSYASLSILARKLNLAQHPTAASLALTDFPLRLGAQKTLEVQAAATRSKVRAEMLAATEARAAAAVFGGTYTREAVDVGGTSAAPVATPTGLPAAAPAARASATGWPAVSAATAAPASVTTSGAQGLMSCQTSALHAVRINAGEGISDSSSNAAGPKPQSRSFPATVTTAGALNHVSNILGHAHSVALSAFALPSDSNNPGDASLAPVLTASDSLAASLAAQGAGLRIVVTEVTAGCNGFPGCLGYGPSGLPSLSGLSGLTGLTVWCWNEHASLSQWSSLELPGSVDIWQTRLAGQPSLLRCGQPGALNAPTAATGAAAGLSTAPAVLSDVTFWPDSRAAFAGTASKSSSSNSRSSSRRIWPPGGQIALPDILPHSVDQIWLEQHNGSVLALNILATPAKRASGVDAGAAAGAGIWGSELLLLQLPVLVVPSKVCAALTEVATRMTAEASSGSCAYHSHLVPLVRDIASMLLEQAAVQQAAAAAAVAANAGVAAAGMVADMARQQVGKGVIGFLQAQGLDECAAVLQRLGGWNASVSVAAEVVHGTAAASPQAAAVGLLPTAAITPTEIEPDVAVDDAILLSDDAGVLTEYVAYTSANPGAAPAATAAGARFPALSAADAATGTAGSEDGKFGKDEVLSSQLPSQTVVVKAVKQAQAACEVAKAARQTAAQASAALANAMQALSSLSANAAAAAEQAQRAENTAAEAARRAEAAESWARQQRALQLIGSGHVESGPLGLGVWGLLGATRGSSRAESAANLFSGPPQLPPWVTWRDVLLGFEDARLEVQYRRLKAMHVQFVDRAALLLHVVREATVVWRLGTMLMQQAGGSQVCLVLLCKYEAVTVLPYMVSLLFPDFYIQHRNFMLMLSQIACALTMAMITATDMYRSEWSQLLSPHFTSGGMPVNADCTLGLTGHISDSSTAAALAATHVEKGLLTRPAMLLVWFYLVTPLLQQLCVPEQLLGACVSQAVQTLLAYKLIFKGQMPVLELLPWLLVGAAVSLSVAYVSDWYFRCQAVAAARQSVEVGRPVAAGDGDE